MDINAYQEAIDKAVSFACKWHLGQYRKDNILPYICHPMAVLAMVNSWGITDLETCQAAVCHDLLEERPDLVESTMVEAIGQASTNLVKELTFKPIPQARTTVGAQKRNYIASFLRKPIQAFVVKIADRCCNTLDFIHGDPDYAIVYWVKANRLLEGVYSLKEEIEGKYGQRVYQAMQKTVEQVTMQLTRLTLARDEKQGITSFVFTSRFSPFVDFNMQKFRLMVLAEKAADIMRNVWYEPPHWNSPPTEAQQKAEDEILRGCEAAEQTVGKYLAEIKTALAPSKP